MNYGEIDALARREIDDEVGTDANRLIKASQMLGYVNEAVDEACRRARLIVDSSTTAICQIAVVAGTSAYALDPRILRIRRAKLASRTRPLGKVLFSDLDEQFPDWENKTGTVEAVVAGMDTGKIRLFRKPGANDTLNLTVVRLPLVALAADNDVPEINARFHRSLVYWVKHKSYNNQDSEVFDKNKSDVNLVHFEREFGPKVSALDEVFEEMNYAYGETGGYY